MIQRLIFTLAILIGLTAARSWADNGFVRKHMTALRVPDGSIEVDGHLDDSVWSQVEFVSDFLQKLPVENGEPSLRTMIGIAYDDDAVYIAGRMFHPDPAHLRSYLDRRDTQGPTEQLIVSFDTYLDRRTAYGFGVSASGVRFDRFQNNNSENPKDFSYNPVWLARVAKDDSSWTVEMRIPFSQLRFRDIDEQTWGVNFNRWIPERNEDIFWQVIPNGQNAWASMFGDLTGIRGIKKSRRIEILPYAASDGRIQSGVDPADPYHDDVDLSARAGGDFKMGLGPNVTLEATFNPDFGQVEADPAEVNLSQYETIFSEKRPFFVEGNQLFQTIGPALFYSRRIGAPPHKQIYLSPPDFVDQPVNSTILGAAKITGRLGSKTSVAFLSAVTSEEKAKLHLFSIDSSSGFDTTISDMKTVVEPTTVYNVGRVQQEFGSYGSLVSLAATAVNRDLSGLDQLKPVVNEAAYGGNLDWDINFGNDQYDIVGQVGFSHVRGDQRRMLSLQQSPAHLYQRPDADHVKLDSSATSMSGSSGGLRLRKFSGLHWLYEAGTFFTSPGFDVNDAGVTRSADNIDSWANLTYHELAPKGMFRSYNLNFELERGWNFGGTTQYTDISTDLNFTFMNYWNYYLGTDYSFAGYSDSKTRGGPLMKTEDQWSFYTSVSSNYSNQPFGSLGFGSWFSEFDGRGHSVDLNLQTRLGKNMQLSLSPGISYSNNPRQWVGVFDGGSEATYGRRYVFARIKQYQVAASIRFNYYFTPDLSLQLYAQPFVSSGQYSEFGELREAGTNDLLRYGTEGTTIAYEDNISSYLVTDGTDTLKIPDRDYSTLSFRSNVVLRWEFTAGSSLYLVWQRNLAGQFDDRRHRVHPGDLFHSLEGDGVDFVAIKISHWIPLS